MNETNENYSWNPEKREQNIRERGLDFVDLADAMFNDPDVSIRVDTKPNSAGEDRFLAFGLVDERKLCLCYTMCEDKIHLITIFKVHEKIWRRYYGKNS